MFGECAAHRLRDTVGRSLDERDDAGPRTADRDAEALRQRLHAREDDFAAGEKLAAVGLMELVVHSPFEVIPFAGGPGGGEQRRAPYVENGVPEGDLFGKRLARVGGLDPLVGYGDDAEHLWRQRRQVDVAKVLPVPAAHDHAAEVAGSDVVRMALDDGHRAQQFVLAGLIAGEIFGYEDSGDDGAGGAAEAAAERDYVVAPEGESRPFHIPAFAGLLIGYDDEVRLWRGEFTAAFAVRLYLVFAFGAKFHDLEYVVEGDRHPDRVEAGAEVRAGGGHPQCYQRVHFFITARSSSRLSPISSGRPTWDIAVSGSFKPFPVKIMTAVIPRGRRPSFLNFISPASGAQEAGSAKIPPFEESSS